ncbi:hypothetical protein [Bacillus stercoris]|uniref:hypothetical protein n=1 Tax=Bacillus stercoris TaxID=2054641 RepID=UPI003CE7D120
MKENFDNIPNVYDNGSLLRPSEITYCKSCNDYTDKAVSSCPTCGSEDVDVIKEV